MEPVWLHSRTSGQAISGPSGGRFRLWSILPFAARVPWSVRVPGGRPGCSYGPLARTSIPRVALPEHGQAVQGEGPDAILVIIHGRVAGPGGFQIRRAWSGLCCTDSGPRLVPQSAGRTVLRRYSPGHGSLEDDGVWSPGHYGGWQTPPHNGTGASGSSNGGSLGTPA